MISSCMPQSRSAQRRPWRSLSSRSSARVRASVSADLQALSHGGAQLALAGVRGGERLEVGDDCRAVDQFDGARGALGIEHHARAGVVVTEPEWGEAESDNQTPGRRR